MAAYVITEVAIRDKEEIVEYQKLVPATVAEFDGKFIARGGTTAALEGDWNSERIVIIEFPTIERAKEWWNSDSYAKAKVIRQRAANTKMIIVEGL